MKRKIIFYSATALIFITLLTSLFALIKRNRKLVHETDRLLMNIENIDFNFKKQKAKNKELYYEINQLTLKRDELKLVNEVLAKDIKNLKSKLKNVNSVTKINTEYIVQIDTVHFVDTVYINNKVAKYNDDYIDIEAKVYDDFLNDIQLMLKDTVLLISETVYKGWWFWKRPLYSKIKIKSENPYFLLNKVETIYFYDKK